MKVKEYISSKKPENKWQFLLEFFKTREGRLVLAGIFAFLFLFVTFAFIIVLLNPEMITVNIK